MSTQSLASAFLSYGADLRTKNIVLEIIFSILPILYQSPYKILDPDDELIIDLMFQYIKQILVEREQYKDVVLPLLEEQFPDLSLSDLSTIQLNLLAGVGLKRLVAQALKDASKSFYKASPPPSNDAVVVPKERKSFLKTSIEGKIKLRNHDALTFNAAGLSDDEKDEISAHALPGGDYGGIASYRVADEYQQLLATAGQPSITIEPFMSITFKPKADMILCAEDLLSKHGQDATKQIRSLTQLYQILIGGNENKSNVWKWTASDLLNNPNLDTLDGKKVYFSRENGKDAFFETLGAGVDLGFSGEVFAALVQNVSLGLRTSVEIATVGSKMIDDPNLEAVQNYKTQVYRILQKGMIKQTSGGPGADRWTTNSSSVSDVLFVTTLSLAEVEQQYDPVDYVPLSTEMPGHPPIYNEWIQSKVNKDAALFGGGNWNLEHLFALGGVGSSNTPAGMAESLFVSLLQSDDFDSLTKSLLVPVTVFNAVQFIPNAEIGSVMREILRSRGCFSGLDEVLDAYMSSAKDYLFGDFPFLTDCSLEGVI